MTKPATSIEYITMPVAIVVGATLKLITMPPSATGKDATLNDISTWPSAMAIIGTQDACCSECACEMGMAWTDMALPPADGDGRLPGVERNSYRDRFLPARLPPGRLPPGRFMPGRFPPGRL